jgi:hypothetical protein
MERDAEITAEPIPKIGRSATGPQIPPEPAGLQTVSAAQIEEAFRKRMARACDAGVWKRLSNAFFEPGNPFDARSRRRVWPEAIVLATLVFAALALAAYFNINALLR